MEGKILFHTKILPEINLIALMAKCLLSLLRGIIDVRKRKAGNYPSNIKQNLLFKYS